MARLVWDFWKAYAEKIGHYQTAAILTLIYWLVVGPIWLVGRLTGRRFLPSNSAMPTPASPHTFWRPAAMGRDSLDDLIKQG